MSLDLLAWPELKDAEAALAAARAVSAEARRRCRCAPHGEVNSRLNALQTAVREELKAELALAALAAAHSGEV